MWTGARYGIHNFCGKKSRNLVIQKKIMEVYTKTLSGVDKSIMGCYCQPMAYDEDYCYNCKYSDKCYEVFLKDLTKFGNK